MIITLINNKLQNCTKNAKLGTNIDKYGKHLNNIEFMKFLKK